jgi:hypothetical protein
MPTIQRQWRVQLAYALQTALNTPAAGAGIAFPINTGHGSMTMDAIPSLQIRQDGQSVRGRHGSQKTKGAYKSEMQAYNFDDIMEAVMRGTWTGGGSLGGSILINPAGTAADPIIRRYFTIEEYEQDIGVSEVYQDVVWNSFSIAMKPNAMIAFDYDWMGTGQVTTTTGNAPNFSSSTLKSTAAAVSVVPMSSLNATLTLSDIGVVVDLTDFTLKVDLKTTVPAVAGSRFAPDVFDGVIEVGGSVKMMRQDLIPFIDAIAETPITATLTVQDPAGTQKYNFIVPQFTWQSADKSDFKRDGGPLEVTVPFPTALVGVDDRGAPNPETTVIIERSF